MPYKAKLRYRYRSPISEVQSPAKKRMEPDELYTLRTCYYLGHYKLALEEGQNLTRRPMAPTSKSELDELLIRAKIANGSYNSSPNPSWNPNLQMLHLLYLSGDFNDDKDEIGTKVETILSNSSIPTDNNSHCNSSNLQLYAAQTFLKLGKIREALKCVHLGISMEQIALCLQIYIQLDRLDLASEQLQLMKQADEDATLTQLANAILCSAMGKSRAEEAVYAYQTLSEQYGPSLMLLNSMTCAYMVCGNFPAAETQNQEAMDLIAAEGEVSSENSNNLAVADALVNAVAIYQNLGNLSKVQSTLDTLKAKHATHPYVTALQTVEQAFQRVCVQYA